MIDPVSVFSRLAFYPTVLYSVLMTRLSARRWYNRIDDTVILGALPFKKLAKQLVQEEGVRGVVSLNEAHELKYLTLTEQEWSELGVSQLKLGIVDYIGTPNVSQLVEGVAFIEKYRSTDGSVYVHCKAGRTRSATLVACYLIKATMNQDRAQILFREGATFVFLDVPERTEFGIDYNTWNVGPKFRGVKMIPPGVHFIYYSSVDKAGQVGPRTGFFYNFKQREVVVRKWDKYLEDIKPDVVPDEEVETFRSNKKQMDEYLGAYPYESYKKWLSLTKHISTELLSRLMPECGRISSVTEFIPIAHRTTRRRHDELETREGTGSASSDQDKPGLPSEQIDNVSIDKGDVCHVSADDTVMDDVLVQLCEKRKSPQNNRSGSNPDIDAKKSKVGSVSIPVGSHCFAWERVPVNSEETSPVKPDISDNKKIINDDTEVREDKFCVSLSDLNTDNANKTLQTNNEELCPCVAVDQEPVESMDVDMIQSASENTENIHSGSSSGKSDLSKIEQKLPIMQEQMATRIRFTEIPKQRFPHDASPSEITKYNMDTSYVLQQMLVNNYSDQYSGILGEIQFAFVCFIIGQVYNAFDQWKHLVHVLCSSDDALSTDTELFMQLIGVLHFQIEVIPEDFFVDIVTKNNFLTITLQEFFSNLETGTNIDKLLKNRGLKFREHLTQKFDWDFIAEPDDYAPVVVELTS